MRKNYVPCLRIIYARLNPGYAAAKIITLNKIFNIRERICVSIASGVILLQVCLVFRDVCPFSQIIKPMVDFIHSRDGPEIIPYLRPQTL